MSIQCDILKFIKFQLKYGQILKEATMCANHNHQKNVQVATECVDSHNHEGQTIWQSFYHELLHHFPYATLSVALSLMLLT